MISEDDGLLSPDIAITLDVRVGALLEIRMGDHAISLSDWWRQDSGLKIEECALCKTHLLIIDGKTKSVFVEVEPTVTSLVHFRVNKVLRKRDLCKVAPGSVKQLPCISSLYTEELSEGLFSLMSQW